LKKNPFARGGGFFFLFLFNLTPSVPLSSFEERGIQGEWSLRAGVALPPDYSELDYYYLQDGGGPPL
jgi:hypothetical protein